MESNCLGYTIAALSAHDSSIRGLAAHIISLYVGHLEGSRMGDKEQLLYVLELVRNSLERPGTKLACIITVFLVKAMQILLKPSTFSLLLITTYPILRTLAYIFIHCNISGDEMYSVVNSFLLLKPNMDIMSVPEFYKLFNSSSLEVSFRILIITSFCPANW